jgi:hypothetical protein
MNLLSRAVQRSLAAAACALFLLPAIAAAAPAPVVLEARALVGGRFDTSGWAAISVTLSNDAEPVSGYVAATGTDGEVRRVIELPAGARKQVTLYLRPQPFARQVDVTLHDRDGTKIASAAAAVKVLDATGADVGVVGDGAGNLRPQLAGRGAGLPDPIDLTLADIPERPEPLAGIETIIWAGDSTALDEAQARSIERWVADGGQLVVVGGPDWQSRTAAFAALLPVDDLTAVDGADATPLAAWLGAPAPPAGELTAATGTLRTGAIALDDASSPLLSSTISGAGRVIYLAVDLATPTFRGWDAATTLWSRLLPDDRLGRQFDPGFGGIDESNGQMMQALASIPSLQVPPAELLLAVIVGYIVLIGPVSYLVLRRMDRRELAWVTAPALVIVFSFGSYGIGSAMKGGDIIINRISLARTTSAGTAASVSTYAGIFSPSRDSYDLTIESDALVSSLNTSAFFDANGRPSRPTDYVVEQGDPAHLRGLSVGVFGLQAIKADAVVAYQPALNVEWHLTQTGIAGTITNTSQETVEDVAVVEGSAGRMVGTLNGGESKDFTLSSANFNGQPASDQIYGFNNFGNGQQTEREMRTFARRSVIDMLVGYGKPLPMGMTRTGSDGPFVLGWREQAAAIDVTVDGHQVRTYDQRVEILGGRPGIGSGEVRLGPSQLGTSVLSTNGDAQRQDFGSVVVGNGGEVHFGISLPLEASNLVASKLTLQVGTDPMSVLMDQGQMGGQTPPGYQVSVLDPRSQEWLTLGDLSQQSRFDVPDAELMLGNRHALEVRISASGVDQSFGSVPLFVGATVEGSL